MSIKEFKQKYMEKLPDKTIKVDHIRMFCLGKELKDDLFMFSYDIVEDITI